jgi:hypothetical protein
MNTTASLIAESQTFSGKSMRTPLMRKISAYPGRVLSFFASRGGGTVKLLAVLTLLAAPPAGAELLVPRGSTWKYNNANQDLGTTWRQLGYNDTAWQAGPGPLGNNDAGGVQTTFDIGPASARFPTVYLRKTFNISAPGAYEGLILRVMRDDGAYIYLNGSLLWAENAPSGLSFFDYSGQNADDETTYFERPVPTSLLVSGTNILAVEMKQSTSTSSDLSFDLEVEGTIDNVAPTVVSTDPPQGSVQTSLTFIGIVFNESVQGVNASDLLINNNPATSVITNNPRDYTFSFPSPATGTVQVAWAPAHGIRDLSPLANAFAGGNWTYTLDPNASTRANLLITEFMSDNAHSIQDEDGSRSDWIEIYNAGPLSANLGGWFLTDATNNLTQWRFPSVTLDANKYLIVWASSKNRTNAGAPLHTNFKLEKSGEFLALLDPQTNIVSAFQPYYPVQQTDISYGRAAGDPNTLGYFSTATPGAQNSTSGPGFAPSATFSVPSGVYTNNSVTVAISASSGSIRYTRDGTVPTTSSPLYAGPLTISTNVTIKARVFQSGVLPSAVTSATYFFLDSTTTNFSSNLPILIMDSYGKSIPESVISGGTRAKGSFAVLNPKYGRVYLRDEPEYIGVADFEIFGQTSAGFAKKPYNIELQDELGNDKAESILGFPAEADWKLRNPYTDKCLINDFMAFELFEKMGHYSVRRKLVEVFVDTGGGKVRYPDDYVGVELFVEKIEVGKNRVDLKELTPQSTNAFDITGGYMFKKDKVSSGDLDFTTGGGNGFPAQALKLHAPKPNDMRNVPNVGTSFPGSGFTSVATNQLNYLRNYLITMEANLYANDWLTRTGTNHYSYYMDVDAFVDQHWIVEFPKQIDGYRLSDYFSKDRGGKVKPEPIWDWNLSFGNADYLDGGHTNGWYYTLTSVGDHVWLRKPMTGSTASTTLTGDSDFTQKIADRWSVLRTNVMNGSNLLARIDQLAATLNEAAVRDYAKYPNRIGVYVWPNPGGPPTWDVNYVTPTTFPGIISEMKKWTIGRYNWIDSLFTTPPVVNHSGGRINSGFTLTLSGPANAAIYYTLDGRDPRGTYDPATGLGIRGATNGTLYTGPITITNNVRVVARARQAGGDHTTRPWANTWSGPTVVTLYTGIPSLRITEIMYHPAPPPAGSPYSADDFQYIELKNIGTTTLNLNGFAFTNGISFNFTGSAVTSLAPGAYVLVVKNRAAFVSRYGERSNIAGEFIGDLDNGGERIYLEGPAKEPILDFAYSDAWYSVTDGPGFSLVIADENAALDTWGTASSWRISGVVNGSPGVQDPARPAIAPILVNEALTHTDLPEVDQIELYNPTDQPVDIGGWFLTDDFGTPKKYSITGGTFIGARGYLVFDEGQFNNTNSPTSFSLSSRGDELYLFSGDGTNVTGYVHGYQFGAAANGVTFGRYITSTGADHFVAQRVRSLTATNAGPLLGPVVISEVMYHPVENVVNETYIADNSMDEFIELHNVTDNSVDLFNTTNGWKLTDVVQFTFPTNTAIAAHAYLLVVNFDPTNTTQLASFRGKYGVSASVPVYGPYEGKLDNDQGRVELKRPDSAELDGEVPYILIDRVHYADLAPWPVAADGLGTSLQRRNVNAYGNDPINWVGAAPTAGAAFGGGNPPVITSHPQSHTIVAYQNTSFSVTATSDTPANYQWRFNGSNLIGATNATLVLTNVQPSQQGDYVAVVINNGGSAASAAATLTVLIPANITQQPQDQNIRSGSNVTFSVTATSSTPISYQWRFNGANIAGATNNVYTIANLQPEQAGFYDVVLTDAVGPVVSRSARLIVLVNPIIMQQPQSATAVVGDNVVFLVTVTNTSTMPVGYRWRRNGVNLVNPPPTLALNAVSHALILTNVQTSNAGTYTVVVTNLAFATPGYLSSGAVLTVLADADGDHIPDIWETANGFNSGSAADALQDADGDGFNNLQEYIAGTNPRNAASYLRVENLGTSTGRFSLGFTAVSNKTYSVQWRDTLGIDEWRKVSDVLIQSTNANVGVTVTDSNAPANTRYYRIVTPLVP